MKEKNFEQTSMDFEITKQEITSYVEKEVRKQINEEIDKTYKKLLREKNKKIIFRNILIVLLLCVIYYLFYLLYTNNYFNKNVVEINQNVEKEVNKESEKEQSLDELKQKYSYLLNDIYLSDKSEYLNDFYAGNLTDEIKCYITLNTIKIESNDNITIIDNESFKNNYEKLFNDYKEVDFKYNDLEVNYIEKIKSYMINNKLEKNSTRIQKEIIDIKENDNIEITTKEAIYKHDKIYNIITDEEIKKEENYSKMVYIFNKENKLIEIKNINN